ncbi:MAG: alpha/beta fold hydrolase [Selenomonadaceae bacterium]|nr:alpha/beta fold hydrolase [Selenomonadaceae bacterium]MBO6303512.1 alpha/beta fold hydrolase [Selenomonadaceae bacterium]
MKKTFLTLAAASLFTITASAMERPVTIADQGSFMAGGKTVTATGTYDGSKPTNFAGHTLHGDHAYVFWQKPIKAKKYGMVFLHGYGQSAKTWETTPDGRDGFQNIFLSKGYGVYLVDEPRRGKAGRSTLPANLTATPDDQLWYNTFRIGEWPNFYDNVKVPKDKESLSQFFHQMTPDTGAFDGKVVADAMVAVMEKTGDGVLVTHSAGGGPGWDTAMRSPYVKGVISLEPGAFPFSEGEVPETEKTTSPFPAKGTPVPLADFLKLTKIPIAVYFGDNIPKGDKPVKNWGKDNWRVRLNLAKKWEQVMKKYGGDATVIYLPDTGITGNTHFLMADLNNKEVADAMEKWMEEKGLAK